MNNQKYIDYFYEAFNEYLSRKENKNSLYKNNKGIEVNTQKEYIKIHTRTGEDISIFFIDLEFDANHETDYNESGLWQILSERDSYNMETIKQGLVDSILRWYEPYKVDKGLVITLNKHIRTSIKYTFELLVDTPGDGNRKRFMVVLNKDSMLIEHAGAKGDKVKGLIKFDKPAYEIKSDLLDYISHVVLANN